MDRAQVVLLDVLVCTVDHAVVEALQERLSCLKPLSHRQSLLVAEHCTQDLEYLAKALALLEVGAEACDDLRRKVKQEVSDVRPKQLMVLLLLFVPSEEQLAGLVFDYALRCHDAVIGHQVVEDTDDLLLLELLQIESLIDVENQIGVRLAVALEQPLVENHEAVLIDDAKD